MIVLFSVAALLASASAQQCVFAPSFRTFDGRLPAYTGASPSKTEVAALGLTTTVYRGEQIGTLDEALGFAAADPKILFFVYEPQGETCPYTDACYRFFKGDVGAVGTAGSFTGGGVGGTAPAYKTYVKEATVAGYAPFGPYVQAFSTKGSVVADRLMAPAKSTCAWMHSGCNTETRYEFEPWTGTAQSRSKRLPTGPKGDMQGNGGAYMIADGYGASSNLKGAFGKSWGEHGLHALVLLKGGVRIGLRQGWSSA
jgi:hypothetical protein